LRVWGFGFSIAALSSPRSPGFRLLRFPENGWALFGLAESLRLQRKADEAAPIEARFRTIWAKADVEIHSSCLCQPGVELASIDP
jgi:hypothetical protein